jgi:hypothetical protein
MNADAVPHVDRRQRSAPCRPCPRRADRRHRPALPAGVAGRLLADDGHGTSIEVYPAFTLLREAVGDADAYGEPAGIDRFTATHGALGTALGTEDVIAIARREGWPAKYRKRGDMFGVIELWIEGHQMMEILTPSMQAEYLATMTPAKWGARLAAGAPL